MPRSDASTIGALCQAAIPHHGAPDQGRSQIAALLGLVGDVGAHGQLNLGQLVRQHYGDGAAFLLGFTTDTGTVTAASDWGGHAELKEVPASLPGSIERLLHETALSTGLHHFVLALRAREDLLGAPGQRAAPAGILAALARARRNPGNLSFRRLIRRGRAQVEAAARASTHIFRQAEAEALLAQARLTLWAHRLGIDIQAGSGHADEGNHHQGLRPTPFRQEQTQHKHAEKSKPGQARGDDFALQLRSNSNNSNCFH